MKRKVGQQEDWTDKATGIRCRAVRGIELGHWCGYIIVSAGHPWFGKDDSRIEADVHGGITYSAAEGDDWRIGFDCAHLGDFVPTIFRTEPRDGEVFRDLAFVKSECASLAAQAAAVGNLGEP